MLFPSLSSNAKNLQYFLDMKKRALLIQRAIINFDSDILDSEEVRQIDEKMFKAYTPKAFSGSGSVEIKSIKDYENACTVLQEALTVNPKSLNSFEFYQKLEYLTDKNKAINKRNGNKSDKNVRHIQR